MIYAKRRINISQIMQIRNSTKHKANMPSVGFLTFFVFSVEDVFVLFESTDRSLNIASIPAIKLKHIVKTYFIMSGL